MTFNCKSANCYAIKVQFRKTLFEWMLFFSTFYNLTKVIFSILSLIISMEPLFYCAKLIMTIQMCKLVIARTIWIKMYHKLVFFSNCKIAKFSWKDCRNLIVMIDMYKGKIDEYNFIQS